MAFAFSDSDDLLLGDIVEDEGLRLLEPQEVRRLIWEQVPIVDARSAQEYLRYHIKAAIHLPHSAGPQQIKTMLCDRTKPVVIYSNKQTRAEALARKLNHMHYMHVYVLAGGVGVLQPLQDA